MAKNSPLYSPVVDHATPRNQAIKLGGGDGFRRWLGPDAARPTHADGPDSIPYDANAGCPTEFSGGSYADRVEPASVSAAAPAGFALKPYSAK
jgi:hypothetical protein